ncbi:hypothetical protein DSO57_1020314 [Entomophthora muscae]|uniref:Uncharacterized protein n=1 Tax=Entomophthora muscae TaxID=34485 RepID=A0ACC2TRB8_9FUNG|nr:hypothetical protein DSO57_1020314 [Entomophthora muscae]
MQAGSPAVHRPGGPGDPGSGFDSRSWAWGSRGGELSILKISFFPRAPSLPILLVQVELDGFLGIGQVAQRFPSTFF